MLIILTLVAHTFSTSYSFKEGLCRTLFVFIRAPKSLLMFDQELSNPGVK